MSSARDPWLEAAERKASTVGCIFALDPGPTQTGWVLFGASPRQWNGELYAGNSCAAEHGPFRVLDSGVHDNHDVLTWVKHGQHADMLAIEMMFASGMPAGNDHFRTLVWVGRFMQSWHEPDNVKLINRRDVKLHVCGDSRAKDSNVRQALIDAIGAVGTKKAQGPCYGVKSHAWSALAVAVTARAQEVAA